MGLSTLFMIVYSIKKRQGCGDALVGLFTALLYPLSIPAVSIYYSGKVLLGWEDKNDWLEVIKGAKMFEHLG